MPEGNKSRVSGDGLESNRPATNFPGISVDSKWFDRLVEKSGLGVGPRQDSQVTMMEFYLIRSKTGVWCVESVSGI